jgi:predicted transcriptional regulator
MPLKAMHMSGEGFDGYKITEQTDVVVEEREISPEEVDDMNNTKVARIRRHNNNTGEIGEIRIDLSELVKVAYEHQILSEVASTVEVEVLRYLRESGREQLTTKQITEAVDRPKSSVSRTLTSLTEKGRITRVQNGVYRY